MAVWKSYLRHSTYEGSQWQDKGLLQQPGQLHAHPRTWWLIQGLKGGFNFSTLLGSTLFFHELGTVACLTTPWCHRCMYLRLVPCAGYLQIALAEWSVYSYSFKLYVKQCLRSGSIKLQQLHHDGAAPWVLTISIFLFHFYCHQLSNFKYHLHHVKLCCF